MEILRTQEELALWRKQLASKLAFVPTMGYLHQGHLSLLHLARQKAETVMASIYVNRLQFNNPDDFNKYPDNQQRDIQLLREQKVDALYLPSEEDVYGSQLPQLKLSYPDIMQQLCGKFRPGHFEGVLLVCYKLFRRVMPHYAIFGLKDYQQYLLVKKMSHDLETGVEVIGAPLVREDSGLALSSRNARLSQQGLVEARQISKALQKIHQDYHQSNIKDADTINRRLADYLKGFDFEYAGVFDPDDLSPLTGKVGRGIVAVAGYVEGVRLIDNVLLIHDS